MNCQSPRRKRASVSRRVAGPRNCEGSRWNLVAILYAILIMRHSISGLLIAVAPRYCYCSGATFTVAVAPLLLIEKNGDGSAIGGDRRLVLERQSRTKARRWRKNLFDPHIDVRELRAFSEKENCFRDKGFHRHKVHSTCTKTCKTRVYLINSGFTRFCYR